MCSLYARLLNIRKTNMAIANIEDIVSEVCIYLQSDAPDAQTSKIIQLVHRLQSDEDTKTLISECHEIRANVISFKIREIQMRIKECDNLISSVRFSNQGDKYELACLETLYRQAQSHQNKLTTYRKLDYLLLVLTSTIKDTLGDDRG